MRTPDSLPPKAATTDTIERSGRFRNFWPPPLRTGRSKDSLLSSASCSSKNGETPQRKLPKPQTMASSRPEGFVKHASEEQKQAASEKKRALRKSPAKKALYLTVLVAASCLGLWLPPPEARLSALVFPRTMSTLSRVHECQAASWRSCGSRANRPASDGVSVISDGVSVISDGGLSALFSSSYWAFGADAAAAGTMSDASDAMTAAADVRDQQWRFLQLSLCALIFLPLWASGHLRRVGLSSALYLYPMAFQSALLFAYERFEPLESWHAAALTHVLPASLTSQLPRALLYGIVDHAPLALVLAATVCLFRLHEGLSANGWPRELLRGLLYPLQATWFYHNVMRWLLVLCIAPMAVGCGALLWRARDICQQRAEPTQVWPRRRASDAAPSNTPAGHVRARC